MTTATETKEVHEPLTPLGMADLLGRIDHEWRTRRRIYDLPIARFFNVSEGPDISIDFMGRPAATLVGPAAGPHSQMTQNIVLAWLGGSRLMELKTVQILDELEIGRPCIDMETIGYNIEWSQELKIPQSLEEYVKAWMILEILRRWEPLTPFIGADPGPHIFDLSVGYDLAGVSTPSVAWFIDSMMDATEEIERLRPEIGGAFAGFRDLEFPSRIADTVTLSTFHGCPPDEIESITKHLMTRHELDVIVKLNPTLLGFERVKEIVQQTLGYESTVLRKADFDNDLQFPRGLELIGELHRFAVERGRRFGIKLTNTLVVENTKGFMPDETMYLSGPPLHVVSTTLLGKLHKALPGMLRIDGQDGPVQVSFSAGIAKENLAAAAGLGLAPLTICSDLLKPGGYGRLKPMLKSLRDTMNSAGAASLAEWQAHQGEASGGRGAVAAYIAGLHDPATNRSYTLAGNSKLPRAVDHTLEMWGCVACNFCVTVCPNDAFFRIPTPDELDAVGLQQYLVLAELCNECGNCMVFCPEIGDPAVIKPRLYMNEHRFEAETEQAFLVHRDHDGYWVQPNAAAAPWTGDLLLLLNGSEGFVLPPVADVPSDNGQAAEEAAAEATEQPEEQPSGPNMEDVRRFVGADQGLSVVSFGRPDGSVHSSVVNAGVMAHPVSEEEVVALVVRGNTVKLRHWRHTPQASIVFRSGWSWIGVEGSTTMVGPDDSLEGFDPTGLPGLLRDVFTAAGGTHDDWDEYDRVMAAEQRTAVFIHPSRITGVGQP